MARTRNAIHWWIAAAVAVGFMAGCADSAQEAADPATDAETSRPAAEYENDFFGGEVKVSVKVDRVSVPLWDTFKVTIAIDAPNGHVTELEPFDQDTFKDFSLADITHTEPGGAARHDGKDGRGHTVIELEPLYSGTFDIPPIEIYHRAEDADIEEIILTDAVAITIQAPDLADDRLALLPHRGLIESPAEDEGSQIGTWRVAALVAVAVVLVVLLLAFKRRTQLPEKRREPAHMIAYRNLEALLALDLVGTGEIERFHVLLSEILREFIEDQYRLKAPERTTEEFFREAIRHPDLKESSTRLRDFLFYCDEVKFANFNPTDSEIEHGFGLVKHFILDTA